jgi:hypothetical protein
MRYDQTVPVSDEEREYMRRLGKFQEQGHADALAAHLALPPSQRLARSLALMRQFHASARPRNDDPTPFYERARRLGLYRP